MDRYFDNGHNITDAERAAFKKALVLYYSGNGRIGDAFAEVEPGLIDRYYRRKKKHPDEMADIEKEARRAAGKERSSEQLAFEARQERLSWEMQEQATEAVRKNLAEMERIASGEPRHVEIKDSDGTVVYKTIIPYPRDKIAAFKALQDAARHGVLLQKHWATIASTVEAATKDEHVGGLMPIFAANTNFSRIEGMAPDGTKVVVNVGDPIDAVTAADDGADGDWARP